METLKSLRTVKVKLCTEENHWYYRDSNGKVKEEFYHDEMFFDLYIITIQGDYYIIDYSTGLIYNYFNSSMVQNYIKYLLEDFREKQ